MKANELRIGNWVLSKDMPVQIEEIKPETIRYCFGEFSISYIEPINLTEEWLVKFGFDSIGCIKLKNQTTFQVTMNEIGSVVWNANITQFVQLSECKYVHQLQNLYFALTGEELEIK